MLYREIERPLLQEIYRDDPWKMLVCCILLNLTQRKQVDGIRHELFSKYPTEYEMIEANEDELSELLKPLGLYRKRAKTLMKKDDFIVSLKSYNQMLRFSPQQESTS